MSFGFCWSPSLWLSKLIVNARCRAVPSPTVTMTTTWGGRRACRQQQQPCHVTTAVSWWRHAPVVQVDAAASRQCFSGCWSWSLVLVADTRYRLLKIKTDEAMTSVLAGFSSPSHKPSGLTILESVWRQTYSYLSSRGTYHFAVAGTQLLAICRLYCGARRCRRRRRL